MGLTSMRENSFLNSLMVGLHRIKGQRPTHSFINSGLIARKRNSALVCRLGYLKIFNYGESACGIPYGPRIKICKYIFVLGNEKQQNQKTL
jgi:hypothetical protein